MAVYTRSLGALCAVAEAARQGTDVSDIRVLSIGTGLMPRGIHANGVNWGQLQWAPILPELMIDGAMGVAAFQCRHILGDRYCRIQPTLVKPIAMDSTERNDFGTMQELAEVVDLAEACAWMDRG